MKIPLAIIKKRLKLRKLTKTARERFSSGDITVSVAESMSTLPSAQQNALVKAAEKRVTDAEKEEKSVPFSITLKDARGARQAQQKKIAETLPSSMFKDQGGTTPKDEKTRRFDGADMIVAMFAEEGDKREAVTNALSTLLAAAYEQGELDRAAGNDREFDAGDDYAQKTMRSTVERARAEGRLS